MNETAPYDVAIIGAGINGAGIARDAALRGLRVIIFEKNDFCSGTSAIPSRLIHGGLRYLEYGEFPLVFESLRERMILRHIAPHLVKPIRICIPIYDKAKRGPLLIRLGMILYDLLSIGKTVPRHTMMSSAKILSRDPGLAGEGLRSAACYYDAQIEYVERLVAENLVAAKSAGAEIRTHNEVIAINIEGHEIVSVVTRDGISGDSEKIPVSLVVNAAGPWVDAVLSTTGSNAPRHIGGTKGSHIIVGRFPGAPAEAYYVEAAVDGRPFFIIPWNDQFLIGTTDIRYDGDLDEVRASDAEIEYLLDETNRVFPNARLTRADIHYAYAGVRPLPYQDKGPESSITRKHIIRINRRIASRLISIIGGKLTTYRNLAEQTVDKIGKLLHRKLPVCRTGDTLLPGAYRIDEAREALLEIEGLTEHGIERLLALYGGRALDLLGIASREPVLGKTIDTGGTVLAAEVAFAIREEFARTLIDIVYRRLMTGLDADQGRPLYEILAALAAGELGWSDKRRRSELTALRDYSDSLKITNRPE